MKTLATAVLGAFAALAIATPTVQARPWLMLVNRLDANQADPQPLPQETPAHIILKASPIGAPRPDSYILIHTLLPSPDSASVAYKQRFGQELELDGIARDNANLFSTDRANVPAFSPDGKSIAFVYLEQGWMLWHDKRQVDGFDPVSRVHFSPDGKRLYYLAREDDLRFVVEADQPHPKADTVDWDNHVVSPDSSVLAYPARFGTHWRMVINGDPGPAWDRITTAPVTAKQGPHVYYVGMRRGRFTVADRHTPGPAFAWIDRPPVVSHDGKTFAYWAQGDDHRWRVYQNHEYVPGYDADRPGQLVLSDDGQTLAAILKRGDAWTVVRNGTPGPAYAAIGADSLTLSPDAQHLAYAVRKGAGWAVVLDDEELPTFTQLAAGSLRFSPDGKRFVYAAFNRGRWSVIEQSNQSQVMARRASAGVSDFDEPDSQGLTTTAHPSFNQINTATITFSADSRHLAYLAHNAGRLAVVLDAQTLGEYEHASHLRFSPDGRHLVYVAQQNGASQIYADGRPTGETFDQLVPGADLHFKNDTRCQTVALRDGGTNQTSTLWRFDLNLDPPAPKQNPNGTPEPANEPSFVDVPTP